MKNSYLDKYLEATIESNNFLTDSPQLSAKIIKSLYDSFSDKFLFKTIYTNLNEEDKKHFITRIFNDKASYSTKFENHKEVEEFLNNLVK